MKKARPHPTRALTALSVQSLSQPGKYADGGGLYLLVTKAGTKQWIARLTVGRKRREMGLGSLRHVSLKQAREAAADAQRIAYAGGDPIAEKHAKKRTIASFAECALLAHDELEKSWRNSKHSKQWIMTISTYANPLIGNVAIEKITTSDIIAVLKPIWIEKPETARRFKQRLKTIFDWAKANGYTNHANPVVGVEFGLPKQSPSVRHHESLKYQDIHKFMNLLESCKSGWFAINSLRFLILTASRTNEVIRAEWPEIDFENEVWSIPASRMKSGKLHRVPLSPSAIAILKQAESLSNGSKFIFPSRGPTRHFANMVYLNMLKRLGTKVTAHGFRSTFRVWAAEQTDFSHDVCEAALAHTVKDSVVKAYKRTDFFDKRRDLMIMWDDFLFEPTPT